MASIAEIMQLCRLCLVKEQVNVPIFEEQGDIRQIFLKITACLPVKISREDNLPKKICNGCLYKLELLYQFWNTSTNAEKQLLSWLTAAGLDATTQTTQDAMAVVTQTQVVLKQEPNPEITENVTVVSDPGNFILQAAQQPIEFPAVDFDYQDNFTAEQELANNAISADVDDSTESEPVAKRPRRTATATVTAPLIESEDDADDPGEAAVAAKTEEDSDDDTNVEPTFVDVAEDQDGEQPGPSGLGKIVEPSCKTETTNEHGSKPSKLRPKKTYFRKQVHGSLGWQCTECPNVIFESRKSLFNHKKSAHSHDKDVQYKYYVQEGKYCCKSCDAEFKDLDGVQEHVIVHDEKYKCEICSENFDKLYDYVVHSLSHSKDNLLRCVLCEYKTTHKNRMLTHVNQIHLGRLSYVCKVCKKGFRDVSMYKEHVQSHETEVVFTCIVCNKKFNYSRYLLDHQQRCHRVNFEGTLPPNQCPICKKIFSKETTAIKHIISHKNPNKKKLSYLCDLCGKSYGSKSKLKEHHRVHTGEKPYKCKDCGKTFSQRYYLTLHERTHSGVKPYSCEYCGKCFNQVSAMNVHIRLHTGEKPFACKICNGKYPSRSALHQHTKSCLNKSCK